MTRSVLLFWAAFAILFTSLPTAASPGLITYQGRLTTSTGVPVPDGVYDIVFKIYPDSAAGGYNWSSGTRSITVTNGLYVYVLGKDAAFPGRLFRQDASLWLGITVGSDPELTPRTRLTAAAYSIESTFADTVSWGGILNIPAGFEDGVDDNAGGDITAVTAGTGLTGGGTTGAVTLSIPTGGVTTTHIANGTITDADISASAAIAETKISGTAATLDNSQTYTGTNTFDNTVTIFDSTFRATASGIRIGDGASPTGSDLVHVERTFATDVERYGVYSHIDNVWGGILQGANIAARRTQAATASYIYGARVLSTGNDLYRYGLHSTAQLYTTSLTTGASYGIYSLAWDGATAYGIYSAAYNAETNYAGYFVGDCVVTGDIVKTSSSLRIDHPLDPENKYLQHSSVESPDMMNIYNGNITTDASGLATVELPDYFEALNRDFRYQLTVLGQFAQAIVSHKIQHGSFVIQTDKPGVEVSWQVTGIRHDKWAEAHRIQVEPDKRSEDKGKYLHAAEWGKNREQSIDWRNVKDAYEAYEKEK